MEWIWPLYEETVRKRVHRAGDEDPSDEVLRTAFLKMLSESTVTVLVQEPWQGSVRFKGLARHRVVDAMALLYDPIDFLQAHYGGGKFKLNFHHGWHFVATHNFKPEGSPKWEALPAIPF